MGKSLNSASRENATSASLTCSVESGVRTGRNPSVRVTCSKDFVATKASAAARVGNRCRAHFPASFLKPWTT